MKKNFLREANIMLFDLEVSPNLGWFYGQYDTTPVKIEQPPILLAMSWKWLGDKGKPNGCIISDFRQLDKFDDSGMVRKLWELLDEAKIVVAHNGKRFDEKMANAFFLRHNMRPPRPYQSFDTLQTARKYFKFDNNKLDYLGKLLVGEGKTEITYGNCWDKMINGTPKEKRKFGHLMDVYCRNDVEVLEKIYYKLLPWATNHPNVALAAGVDFVCPRCGNDAKFKIKAYRRTGVQVNAVQYECLHCHSFVTRPLNKEEKEELDSEGKLKAIYRNLS